MWDCLKLSTEDLPEKERKVFNQIQQLPKENKRVLWMLILLSNKDHICIINKLTNEKEIDALREQNLISINRAYHHSLKTSIFVLRRTPHLMKKLQQIATKIKI